MSHDSRLVERKERAIRRDKDGNLCIALIGGEAGLKTSKGLWIYPLVVEGERRPTLQELVEFLAEQQLLRENFQNGQEIRVYIGGNMSGLWVLKFVTDLEDTLTRLLCPNGEPHSLVEYREWPF